MMRCICGLTFLLAFTAVGLRAQQSEPAPPSLTVHTTLVMVPILVTDKTGKVVFGLSADDFAVTDNGVPQQVRLDPDTDSQPLALVIVVEAGGAGVQHLSNYRELNSILDALVREVEHRVAVVAFDSAPHLA